MVYRTQIGWIVALAVGLVSASCKKEPAAPLKVADDDLLLAAIETQGGVGVLKKGSTFSAKYEALWGGTKISKATLQRRAGAVRLTYFNPAGDYKVIQVSSRDQCWQLYDRVVIPCLEPLARHTSRLSTLLAATWLWPLKEQGTRTRTDKVSLRGKKYSGLTLLDDKGGEQGTLLLDPTSYRVVGIKMQTKLGGKTGEFVGLFSDFRRDCGIEIPRKREYTFQYKPFAREEISGIVCEDVDPKLFKRPPQIKHGTVDLKHTANLNLACTKLKGPLSGVGGAMDKVMNYLVDRQVLVEGPAHLVHRKGPPRSTRPAGFVTDVCYPVFDKAWTMPESTWKGGDFFLFERMGDEFLRGFGIGEIEKITPEIGALLLKEARKQKRSQTRSMVQIVYMPPGTFPADQRVSEFQLPYLR
jgi:hypothetical protein